MLNLRQRKELALKIMLLEHPDFVEGALDLLLRIIEEGSQIDGSQVLFKEIQNEDGSHILKTLVEVWFC